MKAAVCREFGKPWTIEDIQLAPPGPREIRVKIKACAICHSDISYADGIWGGELPAVFGHEASGTILETGNDVAEFSIGESHLPAGIDQEQQDFRLGGDP